jgi:UDP-N-acetylglucosamine 4,6-dehydratase/5-epimerase
MAEKVENPKTKLYAEIGSSMIENKCVLITGGTGSFGKYMLKRLQTESVREIRVFSRDELKQELLRAEVNDPRVKFFIGDIRDPSSVNQVMQGVDMVFHAAALKQVPSCEFFPMQAVLTNVIGSQNVLESAVQHNVGKVVCLSTDKAVYPVNAMGMTKALMEKVASATARHIGTGHTIISSVRYGNVMYSRGSVIPLFIQQIKAGQPLTVTNPEMTRFLLSLPIAIDLVIFAFQHAVQGDIFIRKAPACSIEVLVEALKELFGATNPMQIIGSRHGEKVYETLATAEELHKAEDMGDYFRISMDGRDLNYNKFFTEGSVAQNDLVDYHSHNTQQLTVAEVKNLLLTLPEVRLELGMPA